MAILN